MGDTVYASIFDTPHGSLAEFAVVPEQAAALKPANLDFVQAASIPMVGLTAWQAMHERMRLQPGQKVFIPAGSGGIGTFAIQLARHLGARANARSLCGLWIAFHAVTVAVTMCEFCVGNFRHTRCQARTC